MANLLKTMHHELQRLPKSQVKLTITVPPAEYQAQLEKTAQKISDRTAIKGFRPGKAPFEMVKREVGDMKILEEAAESIIQSTFFAAVTDEKLETIGMPDIHVEKLAPGNDVVYSATVAVLPSVTLPNLKKIKVEKKDAVIDDKKVDETLNALRGMQAKEILKTGPAEGTDKLTIDMDMLLDNVPVEGGQAKNYAVYLSEDHYIPGFNGHVRGMKEGDEKTFALEFPATHYQKQLAGKKVDFKVKAKGVYARELPDLDDAFAKTLGQESVAKLREILRNNLLEDAKRKADQQTEIALLEQLIAQTTFDDLPDVLVDSERKKMFHELKHDLDRNGVSIEQYLSDIKRDEKQLFEDFKAQAEKRAKAALISRHVAKEQSISISPEEIDAEVALIKKAYENDKDTLENLEKKEVRDALATTLQNKKVIAWLKEQILPVEQP